MNRDELARASFDEDNIEGQNDSDSSASDSPRPSRSMSAPDPKPVSQNPKRLQTQSKVSEYLCKTTPAEKTKIDLAVAKFFIRLMSHSGKWSRPFSSI